MCDEMIIFIEKSFLTAGGLTVHCGFWIFYWMDLLLLLRDVLQFNLM